MNHPPFTNRQQKTRLALLNAFSCLIAQRDFAKISVTDIANEAGYGRWTFYQYFASKEDIAYATFVHWMTQLDTALMAQVTGLASPQREYESWRIIFQAFQYQRISLIRLLSVVERAWYERAKEFLVQQFLGHLVAGHFTLMSGVRPEIAARLYVIALMELLEYWGRMPELGDSDAIADQFFTFIFNQAPPSASSQSD
ncbi:MAG: TetR/AcrR family transcriptional regulator [Armatimonadetes bacterium]|nr:TetR/AcrR family transcriptional regulator [Anaerolineae bacterium]